MLLLQFTYNLQTYPRAT